MKLMHEIISQDINDALGREKLVAVLVIEQQECVLPLMDALYSAGLRVIELTLRTPIALEAIGLVKKEFPNIILGAGTVLTTQQVLEVKERGVDFAVAPGLNESVLQKCLEIELPFFPGVMTPSEIERALEYGCRCLKFFPSETIGGLSYLKTANAPYSHLDLKYIPLGGISISNLADYIANPLIHAVGGSWIAPAPLIKEKNWEKISHNVTQAIQVIREHA